MILDLTVTFIAGAFIGWIIGGACGWINGFKVGWDQSKEAALKVLAEATAEFEKEAGLVQDQYITREKLHKHVHTVN